MKIKLRATVYAIAEPRTVGQLRDFIKTLDHYGARDTDEIDLDAGAVYVDLSPERPKVSRTDEGYLVEHPVDEPALFDFPTQDRYQRLLKEMRL